MLSKEGKKSKLDGQGNKRLLSPAPRLFKLTHSAHSSISLQILGDPTCSRLCQRLHSLSCTRHSIPEVKVVMETFLYLEHKHKEPKGVSSGTNVVRHWHFIWEGQCADLISVVCAESMTSESANGKAEPATNSVLHLFTHIFKHLTNVNWASHKPELALEAEDTGMSMMSSISMSLLG